MSKDSSKAGGLIFIGVYAFFRPAVFMWCWQYLHEVFSLPDLNYWQCFWLLMLTSCFRAPYMRTYTEHKSEYGID